MEYPGKFGHTIGRIQHISLMSRIDIFYATCCISTQTVTPTITGFQGIKIYVQYMSSQPYKPIFYPSNYYYGSNIVRIICNGNQVEDYTTHNCLEFHQDADHAIIINIRLSVSGILHTLLAVAV